MQNIIAFVVVLIVWSTTPLAIKFAAIGGSIGNSAFFIASWRMVIAVIICFVILFIKSTRLKIKKFWQNYFIAGIGIFTTLSLVYLAALHISSGMIVIIFAITPIATGFIANFIFKNREFNLHKIIATIIGVIGIIIIFVKHTNINTDFIYLCALFFAMIFQSFISIKLKQLRSSATALQTTTGGLLFSLPFFILSFLFIEGEIPIVSNVSIIATIYLAIFGSVFGFISYYYLIKNASILTVGIIPLITPIFALILGFYLNNEVLNGTQILDISLVLFSLIYYQFYEQFT